MEYVTLKQTHLDQLIDTLQMAVDYKAKSLSPKNWEIFNTEYLPKAVSAIGENKFKIADVHNNMLTWVIDNIVHSRKVVEGLPKKDWIPLIDIEQVQNTLSMLRAASRGHTAYHTYATNNNKFNDLFQ